MRRSHQRVERAKLKSTAETSQPTRSEDQFAFERQWQDQGASGIAGVDEAGRGPLAGPVVAAAVIFPDAWFQEGLPAEFEGLNDSKQLSARRREQFFQRLTNHPSITLGVADASVALIDQVNILQATHHAMNEAIRRLSRPPQHVLVDGLRVPTLRWPHTAIVRGDARSYSIAAASIIAKVTRDRIMNELDAHYPAYGFRHNKGYPTATHRQALSRWGPCPVHRRSFTPVRESQPDLFSTPSSCG